MSRSDSPVQVRPRSGATGVASRATSRARLRGPSRVLVVDDSAFMRRLVSDVVSSSGEFTVVGTARDGEDALHQVAALDPDIVTLDVDMPSVDGLDALRRIMRTSPRPVVMLSGGGVDGGAAATIRALELGAVDFVRKPSGAISLDLDEVRDRLLDALRAAACTNRETLIAQRRDLMPDRRPQRSGGIDTNSTDAFSIARHATGVVCIAASTGGPAALARVIPRLPRFEQCAVLIVQHMPAGFTVSFATRLHGLSRLSVHEARDGEALLAGHAYVAPGGRHMRLAGMLGSPVLRLDDGPTEWGVRPAADPLFLSASALFGRAVLGVVLTGMGRDGAAGLQAIRQAGGLGVVQDRDSAVIAGMPEAALRLAGADYVESLESIADVIGELVARLPVRAAP
ncbi:MAG TPA: chemotaxis response regulator protein-glutamate methylesterase [Gemmatimonas sp.]|nr:chemotaxis response regulator protein-glutamate methylesterase [Gemmatimonas sp.]